jgi:melanoma-associated antigen
LSLDNAYHSPKTTHRKPTLPKDILANKHSQIREETEDDESEPSIPQPNRRTRRRSTSQSSSNQETGDEHQESRESTENQEHLARKLVRYALACEFSKKPIKRTEINQKVLGAQSRQFRTIFQIAQDMLEQTFGMQMEELPVGEKLTLQQRRGLKSPLIYKDESRLTVE